MIDSDHKLILEIDLLQMTVQKKINGNLRESLGGVVTAYKIYDEYFDLDPVIICSGPLTGLFPFISKSVLLYKFGDTIVQKFGGGSIGSKMNLSGIDAIVIFGLNDFHKNISIEVYENNIDIIEHSVQNIGKVYLPHDLEINSKKVYSQGYFSFGETENLPISTGELSINIEYTESLEISNVYDYEKLYGQLLENYSEVTVNPANNPSCFGCPMGCKKSAEGEDDLNVSVLPRCLVACGFSASIYKHIPTVFACLQSVGYDYTHSELENIPQVLIEVKDNISKKLR